MQKCSTVLTTMKPFGRHDDSSVFATMQTTGTASRSHVPKYHTSIFFFGMTKAEHFFEHPKLNAPTRHAELLRGEGEIGWAKNKVLASFAWKNGGGCTCHKVLVISQATFGGATGWGKCLEKLQRLRLGVGITIILRGCPRTLRKIGCKKRPPVGCIVLRNKTFQGKGFCDMCPKQCKLVKNK